MRILLLIISLFSPLHAQDVNLSNLYGAVFSVGYQYGSHDKSAFGFDTSFTVIMYNASIETFFTDKLIEHKQFTNRVYAGVGIGPAIQTQAGIGNNGPSFRIRSNLNIYGFMKRYNMRDAISYPREGDYNKNGDFRKAPILSITGDIFKNEVRMGMLLGVLF